MDHTSKELEDMGANFFFMDSVDQRTRDEGRRGKLDIEKVDLISKKPSHPVAVTMVPKEPCGSPEDNSILGWFRKKD